MDIISDSEIVSGVSLVSQVNPLSSEPRINPDEPAINPLSFSNVIWYRSSKVNESISDHSPSLKI